MQIYPVYDYVLPAFPILHVNNSFPAEYFIPALSTPCESCIFKSIESYLA